jgi:SsrA-binding protein
MKSIMAKKQPDAVILNRRARHDYDVRDQFAVGITLTGPEVKAARSGQVSLKGSYVTIKGGELWLINASFSVLHSSPGHSERSVDTGPRKLLAKKREIAMLTEAKDQGLTIATAKGKKKYDKREAIKQRDIERENKRLLARQ